MKFKLGTRGSQLALCQADMVKTAIEARIPDCEIEIVVIKTEGDRKQGTASASQSDKKDWVYELELAILEHDIDFAIHSGKDIPYEIEPGTQLTAVLPRANPLDAFIGRRVNQSRLAFTDLPPGAKVGTASLRRRAQLLRYRPDLIVVEYRGNVPTRMKKLAESEDIMGTILACAGLERLAIDPMEYEIFQEDLMMPAMNQGILVTQFRENHRHIIDCLAPIVDDTTFHRWQAERMVAEVLEGDCKSAISIYAQYQDQQLILSSRVMLPDGTQCLEVTDSASLTESKALGLKVGNQLLADGAAAILETARNFEL